LEARTLQEQEYSNCGGQAMKKAFLTGVAALFLATGAAHACEDCEKSVPGERLGEGWLLPRPFARIKRTDQNQFNVFIWRPSPRS
jgi:hypothetical protein